MIGILLALQVNNWNEGRKQKLVEKELIYGLILDLEADIEALEQNNRSNIRTKNAANNLLKVFNTNAEFSKITLQSSEGPVQNDTILFLDNIQRSGFMVAPGVNTYTIEQIKSSGKYNSIQNEKLRKAIFNHYKGLEKYKEWWQVKLDSKRIFDDIKYELMDPHLYNIPNMEYEKKQAIIDKYLEDLNQVIRDLRKNPKFELGINRMIYTMERVAIENSRRIELSSELIELLQDELIALNN